MTNLLTTMSCAAAVNPGQALLLGNILSVFTSPNMVARGNFIALMFFVMSLGILVIYFIMGWSTYTIAQVRTFPPVSPANLYHDTDQV